LAKGNIGGTILQDVSNHSPDNTGSQAMTLYSCPEVLITLTVTVIM